MPRRALAAAVLSAVLAAAPASAAAAPRAVPSARMPSAGADPAVPSARMPSAGADPAVPSARMPSARARPWLRPVDGAVARPFRFDPRQPFAAGRRRGVDLAAPPGAVVRAACAGRVSHAGPVPVHGLGATVRCGELTATHLGLRALAVRRGARVARGQPVGRLGATGVLRLGARVTGQRFGYLDPLALIGAERPRSRPPLGPVPRGVAPRRPAPPGPQPMPHPAASPHGAPPRRAPVTAWLGAALLAAGVPLGGVLRARAVSARRRARREEAVAGRGWSRPRTPAPPGGR